MIFDEEPEYLQLDKIDTVNLNITTSAFSIVESYSVILKNDSHDFRIYRIISGTDSEDVYKLNHEYVYNSEYDHLIDCDGHVNLTFSATIRDFGVFNASIDCYTKLEDGIIHFYEDKDLKNRIAPICTNTRISDNISLTATFRLNVENVYNI